MSQVSSLAGCRGVRLVRLSGWRAGPPTNKADVCRGLSLILTYQPATRTVRAETQLAVESHGVKVRVRGDSGWFPPVEAGGCARAPGACERYTRLFPCSARRREHTGCAWSWCALSRCPGGLSWR